MTFSMYQASVPVFIQFLTSLSGLLEKAEAHAEAKRIEPAVLLNMRLAPDMFPLARQVREATTHANGACSQIAGIAAPALSNDETTFSELRARLAKTIDFLQEIKAAEIDGKEETEIAYRFPSGNERKFLGRSLMFHFSMPNFFFHVTVAYGILRHAGVTVGKLDFLGALTVR